jgi:hypothetical protein
MSKLHNPALQAEPRNQEAAIIPPRQDSSILDWLVKTGRLVAREPSDRYYDHMEEEELAEIMETTDSHGFEEEQEETVNIEK